MANLKLPLDITPITEALRTISESMRMMRDSVALLPDVAETLAEIQVGVQKMGEEVAAMRSGVDGMGEEVKGMRIAVEPLVGHLDHVAERIDALEPQLEDMSLAIHPFRRATGKLIRRRAADGDVLGQDMDEADQTESGENVSQPDGSAEE